MMFNTLIMKCGYQHTFLSLLFLLPAAFLCSDYCPENSKVGLFPAPQTAACGVCYIAQYHEHLPQCAFSILP